MGELLQAPRPDHLGPPGRGEPHGGPIRTTKTINIIIITMTVTVIIIVSIMYVVIMITLRRALLAMIIGQDLCHTYMILSVRVGYTIM